jgi:hypothetical protein
MHRSDIQFFELDMETEGQCCFENISLHLSTCQLNLFHFFPPLSDFSEFYCFFSGLVSFKKNWMYDTLNVLHSTHGYLKALTSKFSQHNC